MLDFSKSAIKFTAKISKNNRKSKVPKQPKFSNMSQMWVTSVEQTKRRR